MNNINHIPLSGFFSAFCRCVVRWRWLCLITVAAISIFFLTQLNKIRFDNSSDIWFVDGHPSLAAKARFDRIFGNDEFAYLLFTSDKTPFTPEHFHLMDQLAHALEQGVPYVRQVNWLGNAERIKGRDGEVEIKPFFSQSPRTQAEVDQKLTEALDEPNFANNLISPDKTALTMTLDLNTYPPKEEDLTPQKTIVNAIDAILAEARFAPLKPLVGGPPHYNIRYSELVRRDMGKLFGLVILVQMGLLLFFGRGPRAVVTPLVITTLAVFWTMGTIGLLGFTLNLLSSALPTMLICVSIADSVHLIAAFSHESRQGMTRKENLASAMGEVGLAMMLTSLTTAIGFLAYLTCAVKPYREMGIYVACGVVYAFLLTIVLTPVFYSFGRSPIARKQKSPRKVDFLNRLLDRMLQASLHLVCNRPRAVSIGFILVMVLTFFGYLQVKVESNTAKLLFKGQPLRDTLDEIDRRMGTSITLEFLLDADGEAGIKDPDFMKKLDRLTMAAEANPLVTKADSVSRVVKQMRQAMHDNDPAYYSIPDTADAVAQYLYFYESSGGAAMDRQVGFLSDVVRLSIKCPYFDTAQARQLLEEMQKQVHEIFGPEMKVVVSGGMSRYIELNDILYSGQRHSFIAATLAIGIVMMTVLRAVRFGLLSMLPNIFPVFVTMGFLGLVGLYLDVITVSFAGVIIGVAVDDTIHFFTRFKQEFARLGNYKKALAATYFSVGRPIIQTSVLLVMGNAVLLFSSVLGFFKLGLLFGVAFSAALLADLWFAPALILLFHPLGRERA